MGVEGGARAKRAGEEEEALTVKERNTRATDAYAVYATVVDVLDALQLDDELLLSIGACPTQRSP